MIKNWKAFLVFAGLVLAATFVNAQEIHAAALIPPPQSERQEQNLPTSTPIPPAAATPFPDLETFAAQVRAEGKGGLWADQYFAYRFYEAPWGEVPEAGHTAAYATYDGYRAFFIHNYLGGSRLYNVPAGTRVAVIWPTRIEWFVIDGIYRFVGATDGTRCGYQEPFSPWQGGSQIYSAYDIIRTYYSRPFAIQTSLCSNGQAGFQILTGAPISP